MQGKSVRNAFVESRHFLSLSIRALGAAAGLLVGLIVLASEAHGQPDAMPTRVMVRAVAQDAKVIQDPVGGARITIRELATGRVLAEGIQRGSSGSTEKIMRSPHERGENIYDTEGTAGFLATLELARPTMVKITAEGPLRYPQAAQQASKTMLLVPGRDVVGDGVVLMLHGFIVDIQSPEGFSVPASSDSIRVRATVNMLCGCPTKPGGMWDANQIDIEARILRQGKVIRRMPLRYAGVPSTYEGVIPRPSEGQYELQVVAMDAGRVNFGMDWQQIIADEAAEATK